MLAAKRTILRASKPASTRWPIRGAPRAWRQFLRISLEAEASYPAALASAPGLLFEDHLEPLLSAASTSAT